MPHQSHKSRDNDYRSLLMSGLKLHANACSCLCWRVGYVQGNTAKSSGGRTVTYQVPKVGSPDVTSSMYERPCMGTYSALYFGCTGISSICRCAPLWLLLHWRKLSLLRLAPVQRDLFCFFVLFLLTHKIPCPLIPTSLRMMLKQRSYTGLPTWRQILLTRYVMLVQLENTLLKGCIVIRRPTFPQSCYFGAFMR